jgi:hypothetical protein
VREKKRNFTFTRINNCANYWLIVDRFTHRRLQYFSKVFCLFFKEHNFLFSLLLWVQSCSTSGCAWHYYFFVLKSFFLFFLLHLNYFLMMIYYNFFVFKLIWQFVLPFKQFLFIYFFHPSNGYEGI